MESENLDYVFFKKNTQTEFSLIEIVDDQSNNPHTGKKGARRLGKFAEEVPSSSLLAKTNGKHGAACRISRPVSYTRHMPPYVACCHSQNHRATLLPL